MSATATTRIAGAVRRSLAPLAAMSPDERRYSLVALSMVPTGIVLNAANVVIFCPMELYGLVAMHVVKIVFYLVLLIVFTCDGGLFMRLAALDVHVLITPMFIVLTYQFGLGTHILLLAILSPVIAWLEPHLATREKVMLAAWGSVIFAAAMGYFTTHEPALVLSPWWLTYFTAASALGLAVLLSALMAVYAHGVTAAETALRLEHARADTLLHNILPDEIAERLKAGEAVIADEHVEVTVLFADIVDFTRTASGMRASELVAQLNRIFCEFDLLCEQHGVEKIKTIGDAYMVVAGLPAPRADHAQVLTRMALDMQACVARLRDDNGTTFAVRIGLNSGPVVAGVIGTRKFAYDLWGDTVNVAARMEQLGRAGSIHATARTCALLGNAFHTRSLGNRLVKGKGQMEAFAVLNECDGWLGEVADIGKDRARPRGPSAESTSRPRPYVLVPSEAL